DGTLELARSSFDSSRQPKLEYHLNYAGSLNGALLGLSGLEFPDPVAGKDAPLYVADIDGSGKGVILGRSPAHPNHLMAVGLGSGGVAEARLTTLSDTPRYTFADVNGDGLLDAIHYRPNSDWMCQTDAISVPPEYRIRIRQRANMASHWQVQRALH